MAIDNKTMIPVINKRKSAYSASFRDGEYYEWLPSTNGYEDMIELPFRKVQELHTQSSTFKGGYLYIDHEEARKRLGLETENVKVNEVSREEIIKLLSGNMNQMKKLGKITNRQLLREVVEIAKEIKVDNLSKLQYLSEISGIPFEVITTPDVAE